MIGPRRPDRHPGGGWDVGHRRDTRRPPAWSSGQRPGDRALFAGASGRWPM